VHLDRKPQDLTRDASGPAQHPKGRRTTVADWFEHHAGNIFLLPSVLLVLLLAIFPLVLSVYLSLSRLRFVRGGFEINYVGLANFRKLITGSERRHFLGVLGDLSPVAWAVFLIAIVVMVYLLLRYIRSREFTTGGLTYRLIVAATIAYGIFFSLRTISEGGRPGTLVVTLVFVFVGLALQYLLGLGLALLATQQLPGRRFFRVVYLLPMMITPVGVAYMFRMLTDTDKGPFKPLWQLFGLGGFSWVNDPWGARWAIIIGDTWQWTPLMFIVLLAAIEGQPGELIEAALVDGASRWQIFWNITLPQLLPVSMTLILIRMIESFKIVDLPNVLTNGGPGTATESMTLHAFFAWRTLDLGGSMAVAFLLLIVVMFLASSFVNLMPRQGMMRR
jgi:multiple sugar transport system permease protein